ncbi:MAG TPA: oligosaccharide flippase family protein, partial [Usitatibacter sp.]|nr:oligosaccharide flippase family protein [Usitatibacter sp.]
LFVLGQGAFAARVNAMVLAGIVSAWAISLWNPFLPGKLDGLNAHHAVVVPLFALVWIFSMALDVLPTADERVGWQARAIVALSALRAVGLSLVALYTRQLEPVLWALVFFALVKGGLLLWYVHRYHHVEAPLARRDTFKAQVKQAAPFALSGFLHGIRTQGDQWIAAAIFTVAQFASFSVATVLGPLVQIFRQSVNNVFLPSMSRMQAAGDHPGMLALNSRANCMVALMVYPLLAFAFVFAEDIIALVYTRTYLEGVPVMRIYAIGMVVFVVELVSLLFVLGQGAFAARVNAMVLAIALPLSFWGAMRLGLAGAAIGSVTALYAERLLSLQRVSRLTDTPLSKLQDWKTLAGLLAASAIAAAVAGLLVSWSGWTTLPALLAGGAIMAAAYPVCLHLTGQWQELVGFIEALRGRRTAKAAPNDRKDP